MINFRQIGKIKKLDNIYELPKGDWKYLEQLGNPDIHTIEYQMEYDDLKEIPNDFLLRMMSEKIKEGKFEDIEEIKFEFKKRGYKTIIDLNEKGKGKLIITKE